MIVCEFLLGKWTDQQAIATRVMQVVVGDFGSFKPFKDGDKWVIDVNNNWWLTINGNRAQLRTRYGEVTIGAMQSNSLWLVLEWIFQK